jgi:ribose transport system substrate-binding protein
VPHDLLVPYLAFTQDTFETELPNIEAGSVASHEYAQDDAVSTIKANMK